MKVERYTTAEGWPGVRWTQEVATGATVETRRQDRQWRAACFIGAGVIAVLFLCGVGLIWAVVTGVLVGGMVAAPGPWENVRVETAGGGVIGPWPRSEAERQAAARRAVTPIYAAQKRRAEVKASGGNARKGAGILPQFGWHMPAGVVNARSEKREQIKRLTPGWQMPATGWDLPAGVPIRRKALGRGLRAELRWCMAGNQLITIDEQAAVLAGEKDPQFLHAVLCQLGLPRNPTLQRTFERRSGRASLRLQAGSLYDGLNWNDQPLPFHRGLEPAQCQAAPPAVPAVSSALS